MDYLDEEQRRAITMKSSSISLGYKDYSLNLLDSPGHMDFCSEVSTAARLSDGALVLVDAVEGVHIQTHAVLRQAWIEKLTPCLVLNKIDRLICELRLSPMEAYTRLIRIVHEVNGIVSAYKSEKYLSDVDSILASPSGEITDESLELLEDDEEITFQPQKGNVVFVCALDGWGFGVSEFANFYASRLGANADTLQKSLWGPRYYIPKTKMIVGKKSLSAGSKTNPMFVEFVLEPLWEDPKNLRRSVMSRWLPLSDAVLSMAVKHLPDPISAQAYRIPRLVPERKVIGGNDVDSSVLAEAELVRRSIEACDSSPDSPCVVFVSKMFAMPMKMIPQGGDHRERMNGLNDDDSNSESDECFLAFARIFSGVLRAGQRVFVISSLYDPLKGESYIQEAQLHSIYLMMGQGLKPVNEVSPTLRVAIEPSDPSDMSALMKGLRLLNRADPFVEITVSARGEHVLAAAGEVHLERCIKDLSDRFARVNIEVSSPLVSYRETVEGDGSNLLESLTSLSLNTWD
ncbi:BnaA01g17600D [Brassica napus]|uniref:BnaA01g17600D protein n=1 Tax=Brassica napus TaxID=3708 RepID=A0A078H497_BRANA|nr:BnaA01g17600D [Brassica napus]